MCYVTDSLSVLRSTKASIKASLAAAAASLRVAETKLDSAYRVAIADDDADERFVFDIIEAQLNAEIFAGLLTKIAPASAQLRRSILTAIRNRPTRNAKNSTHVEGAILALMLAEHRLDEALALCDAHGVDDGYCLAFAARGVVRSYSSLLACQIIGFDAEKSLEAILANKRPTSRRSAAVEAA